MREIGLAIKLFLFYQSFNSFIGSASSLEEGSCEIRKSNEIQAAIDMFQVVQTALISSNSNFLLCWNFPHETS